MKLLVTGVNGFVAQHFLSFLSKENHDFTILGLGRSVSSSIKNKFPLLKLEYECVDLLEKEAVAGIIQKFRPQYLLHLASISSVGHSWKHPQESFVNNTNIFLNLVDQVRLQNIDCRILSIGSSEEYGNVSPSQLPLTEESSLNPISPYAVARVAQEMISKIYENGYGMDIIMTRSFNHIGPGQKEAFVVSSFARQLVAIEENKKVNAAVVTGDLSIVRDFVDVRDVVKAYYALLTKGIKGNVYNICSGEGISLGEILNKMCGILNIKISRYEDPALIRPNDNKIIIGSPAKIKTITGWTNSITIDQSLTDIIQWWQQNPGSIE